MTGFFVNPDMKLPQTLSKRAAEGWERYLAAAGEMEVPLPAGGFFSATRERVWGLSDFVSACCVRDPAMLHSLVADGDLDRSYETDDYRLKLRGRLARVSDERELGKALRLFRRREMVRIAWRDLAGAAGLHETISDLSNLADACLDESLIRLHAWQRKKMGTPCFEDNEAMSMVVMALGKLGGKELNFSSDIDLIFTYPGAGRTKERPASNEQYFVTLARKLIKVIGEVTEEGFVFRVDMRLRPQGEGGPLVMSFEALEEYYQDQGQEWERYAWIKARPAAGDLAAGGRLLAVLRPFVFRRYLDFSAFESLRDMKKRIDREVQRRGMADNLKLGPGGIREVEFIGQTFQLLRGGKEPDLRHRRIMKVLDVLGALNMLPDKVSRGLIEAYIFLRTVENRLQAFTDQQTQELPRDEEGRLRLATAMGYHEWEPFKLDLQRYMQGVHRQFEELFVEKQRASTGGQESGPSTGDVWDGILDRKRSEEVMFKTGFKDPAEALRLVADFKNAYATRSLGGQGRKRLNMLMPLIIAGAGACPSPAVTLRRILSLLEAIERRTVYLSLLLENPAVVDHLLRLCSASPWIAGLIARHPLLLDELLDLRPLGEVPDRAALAMELRGRLRTGPLDDLERQMDDMRDFRQAQVLRVANSDIAGVIPLMKVSDHLTCIAEVVLHEALATAWRHLAAKHGRPSGHSASTAECGGFLVVAYGKFGGYELGYGSDLDLVFLHTGTGGKQTEGRFPVEDNIFFARLGQRFIHILTAHTPAGILYPVDMRLRPSGTGGVLVSRISSFLDYQKTEARTWEHQALLRARPVAGDEGLAAEFIKLRRAILTRPRDPDSLRADIIKMRNLMLAEKTKPEPGVFDLKNGSGGIVDIEFLVQYGVLREARRHPDLLRWTDNVRFLECLVSTGFMSASRADVLKNSYLAFRSEVHRLSLQEKPARVDAGEFSDLRTGVREIWKEIMG